MIGLAGPALERYSGSNPAVMSAGGSWSVLRTIWGLPGLMLEHVWLPRAGPTCYLIVRCLEPFWCPLNAFPGQTNEAETKTLTRSRGNGNAKAKDKGRKATRT